MTSASPDVAGGVVPSGPASPSRRAVFTIVSNNYLHFARTLFQSVAEHLPDCDRFCVVVDGDAAPARAYPHEFEPIPFAALDLPDPALFAFRYSILELNTAVKPWAFALLFARGYSELIYLDPDIRVYGPLGDVFARFAGGADIVLTPHLLAPITDDRHPTETEIRRAGTYNLGFCALAGRGDVPRFLRWWQSKLEKDCTISPTEGIFVDQSWVDLVPGLFERVAVLRHPGYNVAYWNLAQRPLAHGVEGWKVLGHPLEFFHFSGFDPVQPGRFSKHQDRFTLDTIGPAAALALDYAATLIANGAKDMRLAPYAFGTFDDGRTAIPESFRRTWRETPALQERMGDDPFAHSGILVERTPPRAAGHLSPTWAMLSLWNTMPDVRRVFPLTSDGSIAHFFDWFSHEAPPGFSPSTIAAHATMHEAMMAMLDDPDDRTADLVYPRGWYVAGREPDGLWTAPDAALPCEVDAPARLLVEGLYAAEPVAQQAGSPATTFTVFVDERLVVTCELVASGPFAIAAEVAPTAAKGPVELRFACSGYFVPQAIGLNDDRRPLAWKAKRVVLGDEVLLDAGRDPPVAPLDRPRRAAVART